MVKVAVLITVYNRRDITLRGLRSLFNAIKKSREDYLFDVFLTDDGSNDGTSDYVAKEFPCVIVVKGDGNLFWNRGMRKAWDEASKYYECYDYYLWFNDDTIMYDYAINELINVSLSHDDKSIIVGSTQSIDHLCTTYGGYIDYKIVTPSGENVRVDYFNGNIVLVPQYVYHKLGNLDPFFTHGHGDSDYGLRAGELGLKNYIVGRYLGECDRNDGIKKCWDPHVSIVKRFSELNKPLGYPPSELFYFQKKHYGLLSAIVSCIKLYIRVIFPALWCRRGNKSI